MRRLDIIPLSDGSNSSGGPVAKRSASPATSPAAVDPNTAPAAANQSVVDLTSDDDDDMPLRKKNYPESQHTEHAKYNGENTHWDYCINHIVREFKGFLLWYK